MIMRRYKSSLSLPRTVLQPPTNTSEIQSKPSTIIEAPEEPTKENALLHLDRVASVIIEEYKGKAKYNPFMWIQKNIVPLKDRLMKEEFTPELYQLCKMVKVEPPVIELKDTKAPVVDLPTLNL